jgi:translation initiation factor 5B
LARGRFAEVIIQLVKKAQAGGGVAVKIEHAVYQSAKMFGRHFDEKDEVYSRISRQSIDVLKVCSPLVHTSPLLNRRQDSFKTDVSNDEWLLIKALKSVSFIRRFPTT